MTDLWHYTCEHAHNRIGDLGWLKPAVQLKPDLRGWWPAEYVWLTALQIPTSAALGLTSHLVSCDRTEYRYRVCDTSTCVRWDFVRYQYRGTSMLADLELSPGARPAIWYVSREPVPVVIAP